LKRLIRTNYSNPSTHGAKLVATVLNNEKLRATWEQELGEMRDRIRTMRKQLVEKLKASGVSRDFSFVIKQNGMFSYSGLSSAQVDRLRENSAFMRFLPDASVSRHSTPKTLMPW